MKLELGSGERPSRGFEHNDAYTRTHVEYQCDAWMIDLPEDSLEEVLALAFIEHLTHDQALDTFRNVYRMLKPGGLFLFDVPDYPTWARYYLAHLDARYPIDPLIPDLDHVRRTLFGWQRWPGDEHKYGWDRELLLNVLHMIGFKTELDNVDMFRCRTYRQRFHRPEDAHFYVVATA